MKNLKLPTFAKNISLSFHTSNQQKINNSSEDDGIYLLQTVIINNKRFTIFFDNGCSDFLIKHSAIKDLGSSAIKESSLTTQIGGVGNTTALTSLGSYIVTIPKPTTRCYAIRRNLSQATHINIHQHFRSHHQPLVVTFI